MKNGWRKRLGDTVNAIKAAGGPDMKALSKKAGLSPGYIHAILSQGRTPTIENFLKVCQSVGVEPGWLLLGDERFRLQFPVIGRIVSEDQWRAVEGAKLDKVEFEPGDNHDIVVIEVRGDSNAPSYRDQDMLLCNRHAGPHLHNLIGLDCAVRTRAGDGYIKILDEGSRPGTFNLRSVNNATAKVMKNIVLEWAAPIIWIRRGGR